MRVRPLRLAVAFVFLLASLAGGAAPRAPMTVDPALAAFFAMGGTLSDICGGARHHGDSGAHCDACRPIGAAPLPRPASAGRVRLAVITSAPPNRADVAPAWRGVLGPALPRAPPHAA